MTLPKKEKVAEAQKKEVERLEEIRKDYQKFARTEGGKDYINHLTSLAQSYFTSAMSEVDRDKKAVLVDTSSGIIKALNRMTEMSKSDSARRGSKRSKTDAKNSA